VSKDEKRRLEAVIRAAEYLFLENIALKLVLEHRSVPKWKKLLDRILADTEIMAGVHLKFEPIYEQLDRAGDPTEALAAVLGTMSSGKKLN
jgi:hypothetical protein